MFNDVLKTSLKNVKLRYLKNICMMFLKFYITFYLHLRNVIEKCFRYNMYITFIKCYKNVMCLLGMCMDTVVVLPHAHIDSLHTHTMDKFTLSTVFLKAV